MHCMPAICMFIILTLFFTFSAYEEQPHSTKSNTGVEKSFTATAYITQIAGDIFYPRVSHIPKDLD